MELQTQIQDETALIGALVDTAPEASAPAPALDEVVVDTTLPAVKMLEPQLVDDEGKVIEDPRGHFLRQQQAQRQQQLMFWKFYLGQMQLQSLSVYTDWRAAHQWGYAADDAGPMMDDGRGKQVPRRYALRWVYIQPREVFFSKATQKFDLRTRKPEAQVQ